MVGAVVGEAAVAPRARVARDRGAVDRADRAGTAAPVEERGVAPAAGARVRRAPPGRAVGRMVGRAPPGRAVGRASASRVTGCRQASAPARSPRARAARARSGPRARGRPMGRRRSAYRPSASRTWTPAVRAAECFSQSRDGAWRSSSCRPWSAPRVQGPPGARRAGGDDHGPGSRQGVAPSDRARQDDRLRVPEPTRADLGGACTSDCRPSRLDVAAVWWTRSSPDRQVVAASCRSAITLPTRSAWMVSSRPLRRSSRATSGSGSLSAHRW